ncbi:hypothetical protein NPIL_638111 [Nephila pilipes]|uniref:Uncharacterized protein n=1 Tax=Nephila pilipes TaxID=299642 RepID=A0A8X6P4N7_NEPPI|nr:hypothetical protein NPIL_638111 [Nephila pilipes]
MNSCYYKGRQTKTNKKRKELRNEKGFLPKSRKADNSLLEISKENDIAVQKPCLHAHPSLKCLATYFWVFYSHTTVVVDFSRDKGLPMEDEKGEFLIHALTVGDLTG